MATDIRACFGQATVGFLAVTADIGPDQWDRPGLGVWSIRDLVGHTSRALLTIETYLSRSSAPNGVVIADPVDYLCAARSGVVDPATIAERGREAGAALGPDPLDTLRALVARVEALVAATPDATVVTTLLGAMTFGAYLPTRTFELTVHGLDLATALGIQPPDALASPVTACLALAAAATARTPEAADVLLALTGRRPLPDGWQVILPDVRPKLR